MVQEKKDSDLSSDDDSVGNPTYEPGHHVTSSDSSSGASDTDDVKNFNFACFLHVSCKKNVISGHNCCSPPISQGEIQGCAEEGEEEVHAAAAATS